MKPKNFADVRFDNISCGLVVQHVFMFQKMAVRINRVFHETKRFSKKFNEKPYIKKLFKPYYGWPFLYKRTGFGAPIKKFVFLFYRLKMVLIYSKEKSRSISAKF